MDKREALEEALRDLVSTMYNDLNGAYGGLGYEGQYEREVQALADAIEKLGLSEEA